MKYRDNIEAYKDIVHRCYGDVGLSMYTYFEAINQEFYRGVLPPPLISFEIMPYGVCIGLTNPNSGHIKLKKSKKGTKQKVDPETIGVLLHETIHYARHYVGDPETVEKSYTASSHNCPYWINEVNRIHKKATGNNLGAALQKIKRSGKTTKRVDTGSISLKDASRYPGSMGPDVEKAIFDYLTERIVYA